MPYLQVDLDGKRKWPLVAAGCGLSDGQVYKGMLDLWEMCWRDKNDRVGLLHLECLFAAPGKAERLAKVLTDMGFLETDSGGYRVRGAEKYLRIAAAQSEAGKKSSGNLKRGAKAPGSSRGGAGGEPGNTPGLGPALTPITNHHSPSSKGSAPGPGSAPPSSPPAPKTDRRLTPLAETLAADFLEVRGAPYKHGGAKDTKGLKALLPIATDAEIRDRWRRGLAATGWPQVSTFAQLASKWNDLSADPATRPKDPTRGTIRAETQDHTGGLPF